MSHIRSAIAPLMRGSLVVLVLTYACANSPREARKELELLQILYNEEAFIESVKNNDVLVVELFLEAGINLNAKDEYGQTALIWAAKGGHTETVKALLMRY